MRSLTISTALSLVFLLAACVPAAGGNQSSPRQPLELTGARIEVSPGETVYVLSVHTMSELGFRDSDLDSLQVVPESATRRSARVTNWTAIRPVRVPPWWDVSLADARIVTEGSGRSVQRTVQALIRIDVPAQATLGPAELRLSLSGRREAVQLSIPLRVRQQAPQPR